MQKAFYANLFKTDRIIAAVLSLKHFSNQFNSVPKGIISFSLKRLFNYFILISAL